MKYILIISVAFLFTSNLFSQTVNSLDLNTCLEQAVLTHPLNKNIALLEKLNRTQDLLIKKESYPSMAWKAQAKIQSESIGLEFDNPMIPSIEIPIYSAQSTLDLNYTLYDGGFLKAKKKIKQDGVNLNKQQIENAIDQIKKEVIQTYVAILFMDQKNEILLDSKKRIEDKLKQMESALKHGVIEKTSVQQLEVKKMELESKLKANDKDRKALLSVLQELSGIDISESMQLVVPSIPDFAINDDIAPEKLKPFMLEQQLLESQKDMINVKNKPKVFAFLTAGTGYPNPLNFFDDQLSLFAIGGVGFSWQFIDFGKSKEEKQLLQVQQDILETKKSLTENTLNRYNTRFKIQLEKYDMLITEEEKLIELKAQIAAVEEKKLEKGVILPLEYLNYLNQITDSKLKLSQYELELVRLKLEYFNLKGKL